MLGAEFDEAAGLQLDGGAQIPLIEIAEGGDETHAGDEGKEAIPISASHVMM